jgi:hypothetical protein
LSEPSSSKDVINLPSSPYPGKAVYPGRPTRATIPSQATYNYYYDEWKKASEKFTKPQNSSLFAVLGLAIRCVGVMNGACECMAN